MDLDVSPEAMERMAAEMGTYTMLYWRRNPAGWLVRDAWICDDAGSYDTAVTLFSGRAVGVEVGLCAVLRGRVQTVDDFERADEPDMDDMIDTFNRYAMMVRTSSPEQLRTYTVYGSWDTGDGHKRWAQKVEAALSPLHAELVARENKTLGEFLVAGVVRGCVPTEDTGEAWATLDGCQPAPAAAQPAKPWWRFW